MTVTDEDALIAGLHNVTLRVYKVIMLAIIHC